MNIAFETKGSALTVHLEGELDQHCASALRSKIDKKVRSEKGIKLLILELGGISFMDSSGIGVILGRYKLMRDMGGELMITNATRETEKLLKLSGVYSLLDTKRRGRANG